MTTYSYAQLETLWLDTAKGTQYATQAWAELMAAIAMAESSGKSDAYNPSGATGLWQILGAVNASDQSQLTDPTVNAHEALLKLQSQGLGAWVTYTSGAYKQFLSGVSPASLPTTGGSNSGNTSTTASLGLGGILSVPKEITTFFDDANSFVTKLMWIVQPSHWLRIGAFALGILLLFGAVIVFTKTDEKLSAMPVPVPI